MDPNIFLFHYQSILVLNQHPPNKMEENENLKFDQSLIYPFFPKFQLFLLINNLILVFYIQ